MAGYRQRFRTQEVEIQIDSLAAEGTLPAWLAGTLVRNTPAQYEVDGKAYRHWFDGLAMLHAFTFNEGQVSYTNHIRGPLPLETTTKKKVERTLPRYWR